jgi:hypothetical protein
MGKNLITLSLFFFAFCLYTGCASFPCANAPADTNIGVENHFTYAIEEQTRNRTVVITGYRGTDTEVNIPSTIRGLPVTIIAESAFAKKNLTAVTIPDKVTIIGDIAFSSNSLTSIVIPRSVTFIGDGAFFGNQLTAITIGDNVILGSELYGGFDPSFVMFYQNQGRRAGTYNFRNGSWQLER